MSEPSASNDAASAAAAIRAAARSAPARNPRPAEHTNIKETIESILVAFILAFIFRAFVVEAFVIPTGSMAPTLLGAHLRYTCDDCGHEYEVNYQSPDTEYEDTAIPPNARLLRRDRAGNPVWVDKSYRIHCPNCMFRVPRFNPADPAQAATNPPVFYGDRILVLKYLYLLESPQRWDVVVFKSPDSPERHDYTQNYIKRLVGKPGESVMILDGDVYVAPRGRDSRAEDFVVQTKPRWAQEAMWRVVFDADHQPRGRPRAVVNAAGQMIGADPPFRMPWAPPSGDAGWDVSAGRVWRFDNASGAATLAFDPEANKMPGTGFAPALTDWLAYDITVNQGKDAPADTYELGGYAPDHNVSDLKLSLHYQRLSGDGPLALNLTVRPETAVERTFVATIDRTSAKLVMRDRQGVETVIGSAPMPSETVQPTHLELIHADYRVVLRIGDQDLIATTPQQYAPDVAFLLNNFNAMEMLPKPRLSIRAERQAAEIRHIGLYRDVFFLNRKSGAGPNVTSRNTPGNLEWATPADFPNRVIHLGPDEYFVCGDNSLISGDGRYWSDPIRLPNEDLFVDAGRVPGRFLLGKAFFVYWPAGFKPIPGDAVPSLVPNFGRMRFIH